MKKKVSILIIIIVVICGSVLWGVTPKTIKASKVVDLVQSHYKAIRVNDKEIMTGTKNQYLIDDFIPKLSRYTLMKYDGELPNTYSYKVTLLKNDGSEIILFDNDYLVISNQPYKIAAGMIDLNKFYTIFID